MRAIGICSHVLLRYTSANCTSCLVLDDFGSFPLFGISESSTSSYYFDYVIAVLIFLCDFCHLVSNL